MNIPEWHKHLDAHFHDLRQTRSSEYPVYAMEHGLDEEQRRDLCQAVWAVLKGNSALCEHFLPWVVYATEIGYNYSGEEYWQTFGSYTPGWQERGDRNWIRHYFMKFRDSFNGADPSGAWANHFTIICWPITHAILPRDLQRQLAQLLYELRFSFRAEHIESPDKLGKMIGAHSWRMTSRFQHFAEDTYLVGRISAALLFQDKHAADALILPSTLDRIARNLTEEQIAQEWLLDARRVTQKLDFKGFRARGARGESTRLTEPEIGVKVKSLSLDPQLFLQRESSGTWKAILRIPDLAPLLTELPQLRRTLETTRCSIPSSTKRTPFARGYLLYGSQQVVLERWPLPNEELLQFEPKGNEFASLLSAAFRMQPGASWLFRIGTDNIARYVRSKSIHAGAEYVFVATEVPGKQDYAGTPVALDCAGVFAHQLAPLEIDSVDWAERINRLGLSVTTSIRIWPAGLPADNWNRDGQAQWLSTDRPTIALSSDLAMSSVRVILDGHGDSEITRAAIPGNDPMYIQLPRLSTGNHRLEVFARQNAETVDIARGEFSILIREPRPWSPGTLAQSGFRVTIDPPNPALEDLWEGRILVDMWGPVGQKVKSKFSLFERGSNAAFYEKQIPTISLPKTALEWHELFDKHVCKNTDIQDRYDLANSCKILFDAGYVGRQVLHCERLYTPVRWRLTRDQQHYALQLIDDADQADRLVVEHATFGSPDRIEILDSPLLSDKYVDPGSGGLYIARRDRGGTSIIVPQQVKSLEDLKPSLNLLPCRRSVSDLRRLVQTFSAWESARLPGNVPAHISRAMVLRALSVHMVGCIAGEKWLGYERANDNQDFARLLTDLQGHISQRKEQQAIAVLLGRDSASLAVMNDLDKIKYMRDLVDRYHIVSDVKHDIRSFGRDHSLDDMSVRDPAKWICEFAICFCKAPSELYSRTDEEVEFGIKMLLDSPILVRLARYLVLTSELSIQDPETGNN